MSILLTLQLQVELYQTSTKLAVLLCHGLTSILRVPVQRQMGRKEKLTISAVYDSFIEFIENTKLVEDLVIHVRLKLDMCRKVLTRQPFGNMPMDAPT